MTPRGLAADAGGVLEGAWNKLYLLDDHPNSGDTGGILDDDWTTVNAAKQELLSTYQAPQMPVTEPGVPSNP